MASEADRMRALEAWFTEMEDIFDGVNSAGQMGDGDKVLELLKNAQRTFHTIPEGAEDFELGNKAAHHWKSAINKTVQSLAPVAKADPAFADKFKRTLSEMDSMAGDWSARRPAVMSDADEILPRSIQEPTRVNPDLLREKRVDEVLPEDLQQRSFFSTQEAHGWAGDEEMWEEAKKLLREAEELVGKGAQKEADAKLRQVVKLATEGTGNITPELGNELRRLSPDLFPQLAPPSTPPGGGEPDLPQAAMSVQDDVPPVMRPTKVGPMGAMDEAKFRKFYDVLYADTGNPKAHDANIRKALKLLEDPTWRMSTREYEGHVNELISMAKGGEGSVPSSSHTYDMLMDELQDGTRAPGAPTQEGGAAGAEGARDAPKAQTTPAEGARELGKSVRGAQLTPEQMKMSPQAQARLLAAKRATELQPKQGPLRKPPPLAAFDYDSLEALKESRAGAMDPSEYIMEAERPGSYDENRISSRFKGSEGGFAYAEDDFYDRTLKGSRSDLLDDLRSSPQQFGFGDDFDLEIDAPHLEDLSTNDLRSELANRYLETGAERLTPLRFGGYRPEAGELAETLSKYSSEPGATVRGMGDWGTDFAVQSRAFERMVNAAKEAGVQLGDGVLKVAKGLGKAGLKAAGPIGVGLTGKELYDAYQEEDPAKAIYALGPGLPGGGAHMLGMGEEAQAAPEEEDPGMTMDVRAPLPVTSTEMDLASQAKRHDQVAEMMKAGVPMAEIRRRVSGGALDREEDTLGPLMGGPSIKSAE